MSEFCTWNQDEENNYDTDCGHTYCIIEGTPVENEMKFCTFCGKVIAQELYDVE